MQSIQSPLIKAIYFHHELIRIHPFSDGNGRTTRLAKNWMLMYHLYPPIFIKDDEEKSEYIDGLAKSFKALQYRPFVWNEHLNTFFNQEVDRLLRSARFIHESVLDKDKNRHK